MDPLIPVRQMCKGIVEPSQAGERIVRVCSGGKRERLGRLSLNDDVSED